jgi:hypothetical protein
MELKPAVETIAKFGKVTRQMPPAESVMSAVHSIFHVADNSVEPLEHFAVVIFPSDRGDNRLMLALVLCDSGKTIQAIRDYMAFRPEVLCAPS